MGSSLRASREAVARRVAPLDKDRTRAGPASEASALGLACEVRLAINCFTAR
jgi:hypothetical protein